MSFELRDYQKDCLKAIESANRRAISRQLVVLPTGSGKTVIFSELLRKYPRVVVLTHRDELVNQIVSKVESITARNVGIVKAHVNLIKSVTVASVQTLQNGHRSDGLRNADLLIVDEAHHAVAPTWYSVIRDLRPKLLVGFTATPVRTDEKSLGDLFQKTVFTRSLDEMIDEDWLVPVRAVELSASVEVDRWDDDMVVPMLNSDLRDEEIVDVWLERASDRKTIAFCLDKSHASTLCDAFAEAGVSCETIFGTDSPSDRRKKLKMFRENELQMLITCQLLLEGFDEPEISCVIVARPTTSAVLFQQMIGRGMRPATGKTDCLVLDLACVSLDHDVVGIFDVLSEGIVDYELFEPENREETTGAGVEKAKVQPDLSDAGLKKQIGDRIEYELELTKRLGKQPSFELKSESKQPELLDHDDFVKF